MASNSSSAGRASVLKTSIPTVHASSAPRETATTNTEPSSSGKKSPDPRHLAIALHHAHQIQARKDTEALIVSHIETLMELPTSQQANVTMPSSEDVVKFKTLILPFQPSDYDNLILERNIDGRCGYTLCPKEHRKEGPKGQFRILWGPKGSGPGGRGKEMKIVPSENLEMWCSDECAERAMYIRVQLSETPAWERTEKANPHITLLEEARRSKEKDGKGPDNMAEMEGKMQKLQVDSGPAENPDALAAELNTLSVQEGASSATHAEQLALERGDPPNQRGPDDSSIGVNVTERETRSSSGPSAPIPGPYTSLGGSIEGYHATSHSMTARPEPDEDVETEDNDLLPYI